MRFPKSLITPNPKSAYGRTNIRRQFKLKGGSKERNNVLNEARNQGYSGNRLDSAYKYLADILDVILEPDRKDFKRKYQRDNQRVLLTAVVRYRPYFRGKNGSKTYHPQGVVEISKNRQVKRKDVDKTLKEWRDDFEPEMLPDYPYAGGDGSVSSSSVSSIGGRTAVRDFAALDLDGFVPNDVWDKKRNMCFVDWIQHRYCDVKGIKKKLKMNKKATQKESDDAIEYYSTHHFDEWENEYVLDITENPNPNKTGYTINHISTFCKNLGINYVSIVDNEIIAYQRNKKTENLKIPSLVFELKSNHLYPYTDKHKVKCLVEKASQIKSNLHQKGKVDENVKKEMAEKLNNIFKLDKFKHKYNKYDNSIQQTTRLEYAMECIAHHEKKLPHYPHNLYLHNNYLSSFTIGENRYLLNSDQDEDTINMLNYLEKKNIKYIGQSPQFFTKEYLKDFEYSSYLNPKVRQTLLSKGIKYRTHLGAIGDIYDTEWCEKYHHSSCYDINKCYRSVMENPLENFMTIQFESEIQRYTGQDITLGLYYIRTTDMTLLHQDNWYSSKMVEYAIINGVIDKNNIRYFIKGSAIPNNPLKDIINKIIHEMSDYKDMKKVINCIYGMMAKTDDTSTYLNLDEDQNAIWRNYACKKGLNDENVVIQKYTTNTLNNVFLQKLPINQDCLDNVYSFLPADDRSRTMYVYGESIKTERMDTNLPIAIQILDQANIKLYEMTKFIGGELLWRKTDCAMIYDGKQIKDSNVVGEYRNHDKPHLEDIKPMNTDRSVNCLTKEEIWEQLVYNNSDEWLKILDDMYKNGGGLLLGRAGTGKSFVSKQGAKHFDKMNIKHKSLAFTNKATIQLGGETIHKFLKIDKDGKIDKKWAKEQSKYIDVIFIDEISMISCELWKLLTELKRLSKCKFILIGDYRQLPPIENINVDWFKHSVIHYLTNNMKCELTSMKRYDQALWDRLEDLWENNNLKFEIEKHDIHDLIGATNICYKNATCKMVNKKVMNKLKPNDAVFVKYDDDDTKYHQDAYLYDGLKCIMFRTEKDKTFKKNESVVVCNVDDNKFSLTNDIDTIEYDIKDFHKIVQVGYATTIHKSQGDTCDGRINIFDLPFMTGEWFIEINGIENVKKALYTAISRGRKLSDIHFL